MDVSTLSIILLTAAAFFAGLVDTIAGGGGLITVPALFAAGLPPQLALGTNKLQACFGSFSASWHFLRSGEIRLKELWVGIIYSAIGASLGTIAILLLHPNDLRKIIPVLLLLVFIYLLFSPKAGLTKRHQRINSHLFFFIFGMTIGFYDGFLGPGTGSFWAIALVFFMGFNLKNATMHTKTYNFTSNIISLIWFVLAGHVAWVIGLCMGSGQLIGANIGAKLVLTRGSGFIRPLFLCVVFVLLMVQLFEIY